MRRVPYHQSVFDLLDLQPRESPQAREIIEAHEAQNGRLPEAVRQWYLIDRVVPLRYDPDTPLLPRILRGHLWYDDNKMDWPTSLEMVLREFAGERLASHERVAGRPAGTVKVMTENQSVYRWYVQPDGSDDPPVFADDGYDMESRRVLPWARWSDSFSDFVFDWFVCVHGYGRYPSFPSEPYRNGLWLYAPHAEALLPPYLDFLIEQFHEDYRRQVAGGVMQYGFSHADGRIRVTSDDPEPGGVSAWLLHADSAEHLYRLAERVLWCGNLREALRHHTEVAGPVMDRLRGRG